MEAVLDSIRRIVRRWTTTASPLVEDANSGDTIIKLNSTLRFREGDEVLLHDPLQYEVDLRISEVIDNNYVRLSSPILYDWTVDQNSVIEKAINQMIVNGIYIGDPDVIPMYPAITVNAISRNSEWMTLESTKERYEIEVSIYALESTHEDGLRFIMQMVEAIQHGLKRNIYPLVGDYETTSLIADASSGDIFLKVADSSVFEDKSFSQPTFPKQSVLRAFIEDQYKTQEFTVTQLLDETTIEVGDAICESYLVSDNSILIHPKRFIYNSWPSSIDYGKISKGSLLQAAVIKWFAEEEELQEFRFQDTHLK